MLSRLDSRFITTLLIVMSSILVGCQDTIPYRETITPQTAQTTGGTDGGEEPPAETVRPSNAVRFKTDFCACQDKKAITFGNCASFCSNKATAGAEILYANFDVTEDVSLNPAFGNTAGWCRNQLENEEAAPKCVIEAKDDSGAKVTLDVELTAVNSIRSTIDKLEEDKTYIITLVESTSGARSNSIQFIKFSADMSNPILGPLKVAPISQYTCLYRPVSDEGYYDQAFRIHFYFLPSIPPAPMAPGSDLICHDIFNPAYGAVDDPLYPRLELIPGVFNLWDVTDPRFFDNNGNLNNDVNDIIIQKTKNFGGNIASNSDFFLKFPAMTTVEENEEAGNNTSAQALGWYMAPWIDDQNSYRSYCLTSTQYNSTNPLFRAMRDVIGVDTEGIYVGVKAPESMIDQNGNTVQGPEDFILIRETDLKAVWFYMKNGVPTVPTDTNVSSVPVYFYYPLNKTTPFVKSSSQRIYQVKGANELSSGQGVSQDSNNTNGSTTKYPPHDRKIGCVPKF